MIQRYWQAWTSIERTPCDDLLVAATYLMLVGTVFTCWWVYREWSRIR